MKLIKIIGHPVLVMSMFLLVLISGEQFGGFYLIYLLMGLSYGAAHSIIALIGLASLFTGYKISRGKFYLISPVLLLIGDFLIILALFTFFRQSKGYNDSTFEQVFPLISIVLFGICLLFNMILAVRTLLNPIKNKKKMEVTS